MAVSSSRINFAGESVCIDSAVDGKIDISEAISDPDHFYGSMQVDHVVHFGTLFEQLIGTYNGKWDTEQNVEQGIVVLEEHVNEARDLIDVIGGLAKRAIGNTSIYDDIGFCTEYYELTQAGYAMLRKYEAEFHMPQLEQQTLVSLERAGLVSTRAALGVKQNAHVPNEHRVVTKRTHMKGEASTALSVTVVWRDKTGLAEQVNGKQIAICDFVNPASGASVDAFAIAAKAAGAIPTGIHNRSINGTKQGIRFAQEAFQEMGIPTTFYSIGICDTMNEQYYLMGKRSVGDAGHLLRHFLPEY